MSDHHPEYVRGVEDGIEALTEVHEVMCPHAAEVEQLRERLYVNEEAVKHLRWQVRERQAEVERLREQRDAVASKAVEFMDEARQVLRALDDREAAAHLLDVGISRIRALLDGEA